MRVELSIYLYESTYKTIKLLEAESNAFVSWICPLLKQYIVQESQHVYFEGDDITNIYFMKSGSCGFVLPKHNNFKYINITLGSHFGVVDILASLLEHDVPYHDVIDNWITRKDSLKR